MHSVLTVVHMGEKGLMTISFSDEELSCFPVRLSPSGRRYRYVEYQVRVRCTQLRLTFEFIVPRSGIFADSESASDHTKIRILEPESDLIIRRAEAYGQTISQMGLHDNRKR